MRDGLEDDRPEDDFEKDWPCPSTTVARGGRGRILPPLRAEELGALLSCCCCCCWRWRWRRPATKAAGSKIWCLLLLSLSLLLRMSARAIVVIVVQARCGISGGAMSGSEARSMSCGSPKEERLPAKLRIMLEVMEVMEVRLTDGGRGGTA
mmetsp:Transcript_48314/g.78499  ORF Transcript_48314/g.78499 Transcript_48314/m.78499 type:complete len:151 (-) Transcript_48314:659-1111(-)